MNLICVILADAQVDPVLDRLTAAGHRATRMSSTGGFLRQGNTTLLIGVEHEQLESAIASIRDICLNSAHRDRAAGCATVFALPAEGFQQT